MGKRCYLNGDLSTYSLVKLKVTVVKLRFVVLKWCHCIFIQQCIGFVLTITEYTNICIWFKHQVVNTTGVVINKCGM